MLYNFAEMSSSHFAILEMTADSPEQNVVKSLVVCLLWDIISERTVCSGYL